MSSGGQVVGGLVGAVAGFFLGGGTPSGALYGAQIGMTLGGYLDPPKGPTVNGPRLNDLSVQTSTYGAVIPRVYGTVTVNGNVFWLENNRLKETVTKKKSGGKGGGGKTTTRTYTYSATFAVGLCQGPIVGVRRIWIDPDLIYDAGSSDPDTLAASNAAASGFQLYLGTDTQAPDARMQATLGVANTPAWRGLAYLVFYDLALERYANSLAGAQVRVEVVQLGSVGGPENIAMYALPSLNSHHGPVWDGSKWVGIILLHTTGDRLVTSTDMTSWTVSDPFPIAYWDRVWRTIEFFNGVYVALSDGAVATSYDLVTWNVPWKEYYSSWKFGWIVPGNGGFLLVEKEQGTGTNSGNGVRTVFLAADLTTWSYGWMAPNVNLLNSQPAWNGAAFLAGGNVGATPVLYLSSTGIGAWSPVTVPAGVTHIYGMCAFGSAFLLIGYDQGLNLGKAAISTDNSSSWSAWVTLPTGTGFTSWRNPTWNGTTLIAFNAGQYANTYWWVTSTDGVSWELKSGSVGQPNNRPSTFKKGWNGSAWGSFSHGVGQSFLITPETFGITPQNSVLSAIVVAECLQSGLLTSGDIDVTALTQSVRGYRVGSIGAIRAALEPLQAAWPFDVVPHGYRIRFVVRGGASVVTIPAADLDARGEGDAPGVQITTSREMDAQLPRRVTVQHLDYDREHNAGTQYAERLNTAAINALVLDLPIVLTATEAAGKAEVLLYLYWLERYDVAVTLPPTYNQLEPGDVVTLVTPEGNVSLRMTAIHYTSDGRIACQAKYANAAIYTPTAVGASPVVSGTTTITPVGASVYVLMDVPMVSSAQSGPSFLVGMTGALAGWKGGVLMQSTDAGSTWATLQDFGPPGTSLGSCTNSIGVVEHRVIDHASVLNVTLTQGELFSVTQLAMLGGANHFAYGADGRWEIIAAQDCTLVSGTSYVLQNLLRGRFGSEWAMGLHAGGDALVLLDTADVAAIAMSSGSIGLSYVYRGVTVDRDISTDANRAFAYQGVNLKPLAPVALTGNRDPSSNDWTLTWIRRTRDGGEWRDYVDASLGEASESYAIDVYADDSYATVKRTITASVPSCVYASADQISDFGTNQATLHLKLSQISATVGRGYPLTASITR
jgi:hypothetical protein